MNSFFPWLTLVLGLSGLPALAQQPAKPAQKPVVRPAWRAAAKPAGRPATKPAAKPTARPAAQPATKSATPTTYPVLPGAPAHPAADHGPAVRYAITFPNAVHHEARVTVTFSGLPGALLRVRMARSSPGRYALHDFIKNVYYVVATDGSNHPLFIERPHPYGWDIRPGSDGKIVFSYTLYGDRTDGTYVGIDQQHAHLNLPATLCYALGLENRAAELKLDPPANWKIATQLPAGPDKNTFTAPNLQYLLDSPVVLGNLQTRSWQVGEQTIEMAALYDGPAAELDAFAKNTQRVVAEEKAIFGALPTFDFGRYTFLADYLGQASGDGMEHRNSCSLTSARPLRGDDALRNLGTVAHEFIHCWNVERLRPRDLEPFDFQRANMSDALWFAEGFTQYYGELALRRAKFYDDEQFYERLSYWANVRLNNPGARYASAVDMSRQAVFNDAAASIDPTNRVNTYLSYYDQGAGLALVLDLQLRQNFRSSLDQYMQALWQHFGRQENLAPAHAYTLRDLQRVLGEVSKDTAFAGRFFRQHVVGHEQPRFAENLLAAGLAVVPSHLLGAALPRQVEFDAEGRCIVAYNTQMNTGLYKAGIDRGDQLVVLDGKEIRSQADLDGILRKHSPNDLVAVKVRTRGGVERSLQLVLTEDPNVQVEPLENIQGSKPSPAQLALRDSWLTSQIK